MNYISIEIKNKIARLENPSEKIVCGNSDYIIKFLFDEEWDAYHVKTARFTFNGEYTDVVFSGDQCEVPVMQKVDGVFVGVYAGELHTTTPAFVNCEKSILCRNGTPKEPSPDVYGQLMEKLNSQTLKGEKGDKGDKGDKGEQGIQGNTGATGADGKDGADGKSAYEIAKENGFEGSETEWLASMKGASGKDGENGKDGASGRDGENGKDGQDGKDGVSVTHSWNGTVLTVTSASGTSSADLKGEDGKDGIDGKNGIDGKDGADGKDYVLTEADKQEIVNETAKKINTSDFVSKSKSGTQHITSNLEVGQNFQGGGYLKLHSDYGGYIKFDPNNSSVEFTDMMGENYKSISLYNLGGSSGGGGMKLTYLGDLVQGIPTAKLSKYKGIMFLVGLDYDWGMQIDVASSGILWVSDIFYASYGGRMYFPFSPYELSLAGIYTDPYGEGISDTKLMYLDIVPDADWMDWEFSQNNNPFIGARMVNGDNAVVFAKIYGVEV